MSLIHKNPNIYYIGDIVLKQKLKTKGKWKLRYICETKIQTMGAEEYISLS